MVAVRLQKTSDLYIERDLSTSDFATQMLTRRKAALALQLKPRCFICVRDSTTILPQISKRINKKTRKRSKSVGYSDAIQLSGNKINDRVSSDITSLIKYRTEKIGEHFSPELQTSPFDTVSKLRSFSRDLRTIRITINYGSNRGMTRDISRLLSR